MMLYERNNGASSNHSSTIDTGNKLLDFDFDSLAVNNQETRLLLVGHHELAFINFETITSQIDNTINDDSNALVLSLSDTKIIELFDTCNINRPIVEWNHADPNQYAVAIDRHVRTYTVDHTNIHENTTIDSKHQRPISTISYSPHDPAWLLTGSLDGQIQVWDTRHCSQKSPANLKFSTSTPFSIRRIQWSSMKSDNPNQLAVQCDRCVRIYDIRRTDAYLFPSTDLEHTQRIVSMDWNTPNHTVATLSIDQTIKLFSTNGHVLAESLPNEQSPYTLSKMRTTTVGNLLICATRDTPSSTYGFIGWRCDEDQCIRPLTDRIVSTTPSPIVDFCFVTNPRFLSLFNSFSSTRFNDESINRFLLLTWCRDGRLYLVDMDSTFRQAWNSHSTRSITNSFSDSSSSIGISRTLSNLTRQQQTSRRSSTMMTMDVIQDEVTDGDETDDDDNDNKFQAMDDLRSDAMESSQTSDENNISITYDLPDDTMIEVSVQNELKALRETYGPHIIVETKEEQRRMCIVRCIYSTENSLSFRIYLILSRHYPIISQLFVRFKLSTILNDERLKVFQSRIQIMLDETSYDCFYQGQLCLHRCLLKLKNLLDIYHKQEKSFLSMSTTTNHFNKKREQSSTNSEADSINGLMNSNPTNPSVNNNNNNNRAFGTSSSSTRTSDSQLSGVSFVQGNRRTCGARFCGATHLICFGRISNNEHVNSAPVVTALSDGTMNRPQSVPLRSISLTVSKSRENSGVDERSGYRPPTTNTMQIQPTPNNQRNPMSSAPVRSSLGTSVINDHQRITAAYRHSLGQSIHPQSAASIYDVSILLPVSKKLADDYIIDLNNPIEMCETNQRVTEKLGKDDLTHCWRLIDSLLSIQDSLETSDAWFQSPIAQGLIKHLVSNYMLNGDIQSASMFLLTMSQTPYLQTKIKSKLVHEHDPILYSYASLLHRWKHFYKRTQILSQIDHNCQSPAPFNQTSPATTRIVCSVCLQPVCGQHFLCAVCGHGGHLKHLHEWFSSKEQKHRFCPEKDCSCRCTIKQQELLILNPVQIQQQTSITTPRSYFVRQSSGNIRPL